MLTEYDADLEVELTRKVCVILHSRGGKLGTTEARNPEYNSARRLILERMSTAWRSP